mgnify:CR=1 FL=1
MKKLLAVLIIMCAFISACGVNAGNNNSSLNNEQGVVNAGNKKPSGKKVKMDNYLEPVEVKAFKALFDFKSYLEAYGATDLDRVYIMNDYIGERLMIFARFPNNVVIEFHYVIDQDTNTADLVEIYVYTATSEVPLSQIYYDPSSYIKQHILSEWTRQFETINYNPIIVNRYDESDPKYEKYSQKFVVKPYQDNVFSTRIDSETVRFVTMPVFFDDMFKKTVVPYLKVKNATIEKDPLMDTKIGGYLFEYDH